MLYTLTCQALTCHPSTSFFQVVTTDNSLMHIRQGTFYSFTKKKEGEEQRQKEERKEGVFLQNWDNTVHIVL